MKIVVGSIIQILVFSSIGYADTFTLAGKNIVIPEPKGFVLVTDGMTQVNRVFSMLDDPINNTLTI